VGTRELGLRKEREEKGEGGGRGEVGVVEEAAEEAGQGVR
jgi:hypothetical protein